MNANPETQHKVLILGNQEVGKTAIVNSVSFIQTFEINGKPGNNTVTLSRQVTLQRDFPR